MKITSTSVFSPAPGIESTAPYRTERRLPPIELYLDGNEGAGTDITAEQWAGYLDPETLRRYPSAGHLERLLADRHGLDPNRVLVTAGGDEAIDRFCRVALSPGRSMILPTPSFAMFPHYARLMGANLITLPWPEGPYPVDDVLSRVDETVTAIVLVSPNNPTGAVAAPEAVGRLARSVPAGLILLDLAYAEFAESDLTETGLEFPNVVVVKSLSKAWGLAGLRVGYALGHPRIIHYLRTAGGPYTVPGLSLAIAEDRLRNGGADVRSFVNRVKLERQSLRKLLIELGADALPSDGNFVLADFADAEWIRDGLAAMGIAVRLFDDNTELADKLRITCPGTEADYASLEHALKTVLAPEAVLLDLDGVIADVSRSYRTAIIKTAETFGVTISHDDISRAKAEGNANNDWVLTQALLSVRGIDAALPEVTGRFEALYHGTDGKPGLRKEECLLWPVDRLRTLARRYRLGLVTGRPRKDAELFFDRFGLGDLFSTIVCMEDAPPKPDPTPIRLAMERLKIRRVWMIGDTPDDCRAARTARALPLGIPAPGDDNPETHDSLYRSGAGRILKSLDDLERLLP